MYDSVQVDGEKLALFLETEVVNRKHKRRRRVGTKAKIVQRAEEAEQEGASDSEGVGETPNDTSQTVGQPTVRNYVNAIVDLWSKQQAVSGGQIAHPREHAAVKQIMQTLARQEAARKKDHHNNRRDGQYPFSKAYMHI